MENKPTIQDIESMKRNVEMLKNKLAKAKGTMEGINKEGHTLESLTKKLQSGEKKVVELGETYDRLRQEYQSKYIKKLPE